MQSIMWLTLVLTVFGALLYSRKSLLLSTAVLTGTLGLWTNFGNASILANVLVWAPFIFVAVVLNVTSLRRALISDTLLSKFRKIMPNMSDTEREALEAGDVWWDADLFSGKPHWPSLLNNPKPQLSEEELAFIDGPTHRLCEMLDDWRITHEDHDMPQEVWQFLKNNGFFAMIIPKHYGGLEFSALAHSSVVMKIAGRSITAAVTVMVPNSLGPGELLLRYGTEQQKDFYLPRLAKGEEIPCFALTSPEAGSDAASMTDYGVVCRGEFEGVSDVLGIRLNWKKRYITLGPVATVLGLAFKLYDPDHLIGETDEWGITCALIPTNTPGLTIGARHWPLDSAFQNGPNEGKDVFIPIDWIIGGQSQAGQGWRMLMECLSAGRSISLPALATGAGKLTSRATGAYARVRRQFKTPIGRFEGIEEALARIAGTTYTMDAARTLTASAIDQKQSPSVVSAIVKYNLTEGMRQCVNDAMDIHGGNGICMGPSNILARIYQSIPISITVEGANILTRSLIIFGQGAIRCHPFVYKELLAAKNTNLHEASIDFDKALWGHIGFTLSNAVRTLFNGLTFSRFAGSPVTDPTRRYYQHLTRFSSAFALTTDIAMAVLGGNLKRKEKLSGRLADVLSHMYLMSATLKRFQDDGQPEADLPILKWSCETSLRVMQQSMDKFLNNFPNQTIAWGLRRLIFPWGKSFRGPTDQLGHEVASLLLSPSATRDRLTDGVFLPHDISRESSEPLAKLEYALQAVIAAEPCEKKLRSALQSGNMTAQLTHEDQIAQALKIDVINQQEADIIREADAARLKVINVDDFSPDQLTQTSLSPQSTAKECA